MAIWKDSSSQRQAVPATPAPDTQSAHRNDSHASDPSPVMAVSPAARAQADRARAESVIAADIMIEGKIEGTGSVRIAGKFKGDVNVQGDLNIETGAKLTGSVRADKVTVAGELDGNIEGANQVNLLATGAVVGDIKAGSVTVAAGGRVRGHVEFGWEDKTGKKSFANGSETVGNA